MTKCGAPEGEPVTAVRAIREVIWGRDGLDREISEACTLEVLSDALVERWKVLLARSPLRATRPTVGLDLSADEGFGPTICAEMVAAVTVSPRRSPPPRPRRILRWTR
jgi:hypothetical protein